MSEPKYDEDLVNLGYLKRALGLSDDETYTYISKHYGSKPQPPYHKGDTWIDGKIVYTCINDREYGTYQSSDWTTESGAKEEAESKNKVFLVQPSNYRPGDMWILQSDNDHKAGKKGEMLISTAGKAVYDEDDWINMLGYGTIRSINEVANNINDALLRLSLNKTSGIVTIFYAKTIPSNPVEKDLWYVTETVSTYNQGDVYKYNGSTWEIITDKLSIVAFDEANEARLVEDGKIQSFYATTEPSQGMGVGDIWTDTATNKLYRYNGTKWVAVYDTNINEIRTSLNTTITRTTTLETDLGEISASVGEIEETIETDLVTNEVLNQTISETKSEFNVKTDQIETSVRESTTANIMTLLNNGYLTAEQVNALVNGNAEDIALVKQQLTQTITNEQMQIAITTAIEGGVSYLKNTLFTINDEGLWIATNQDEFNAQYNNKGMYLYTYDQMIAKFDIEGTTIRGNLNLQGELVTPNLRMINVTVNNVAHTHIHWIGG